MKNNKTDLEKTLYKTLKKDILKILIDYCCEYHLDWLVNANDNELTIKVDIDCKGANLL